MAYYSYGEIKERVRDYLDGRTDIDDKILQWVNDTRRDIALAHPTGFAYLYTEATQDTVAGVARYALPDDYLGHLNLFVGTKKLMRVRPNEFDSLYGTDSDIATTDPNRTPLYTKSFANTGEPDYYIDRGMEFELWPIPDGTYRLLIRYYAQPSPWSSDDDHDFISTFHTDAIIFGAVWRGAIYLEDADKKAEFGALYREEIAKMVRVEKDKRLSDMNVRMKTYKDFPATQFKRIIKIG